MTLLLFTTALALLIVGVFTAGELLFPKSRQSLLARLPGFTFIAVGSIFAGLLANALQLVWQSIGIQPLVVVPIKGLAGDALAVTAGVILYDLMAYWNHRFLHRFLWPVHSLHHSAPDLCAANGYAHFTERGIRFLLFAAPLSFVHFDFAATPAVAVLTISALEIYIHSSVPVHLGPLRWIFVDNRFHRIHHSLEERHFDKNFGILFSIWDRLFGTASEPRKGEWPATGVPGLAPPDGLIDYVLFPIRRRGSVDHDAGNPSPAATTATAYGVGGTTRP